MANYWRNIIYLKKYTNHEMIKKVGFAKIEYRNGNLKGYIKINEEKSSTTWKAYIGHQAEGTLFLTLLGTLDKENTDFILTFAKTEQDSKNKTLIIIGENSDYCSENSLENIVIQITDSTTSSPSINVSEKDERKMDEGNVNQEKNGTEKVDVEKVDQEKIDQEKIDQEKIDDSTVTDSTVTEPEIETFETPKQSEDWIDKILKNAAGMYPFEDNEFHQCVKLDPKDFGLLPSKDWVLGSNSFLLNGYYSYRHILFGVKENDGKKVGYLGVPGMYHRREIFIANMFGFSLFKGVQEKKNTAIGDFGYWIMQID